MFFVEYKSLLNPKLYKNLFRKRIILKMKFRAVGDTLLLSTMAREIKRKEPDMYVITETRLPELFRNNPNIDENRGWHIYSNKNTVKSWYDIQKDQREHVIFDLLSSLPYDFDPSQVNIGVDIFLSQAEIAVYNTLKQRPSISIMSSGKTSFSPNREWGEDNFQAVADYFNKDFQIAQIGSLTDPLLDGAIDFRGKNLRETAVIISNSRLFIGQEGGFMHLANGVKKRSVIIFGGYLRPSVTGYQENINLYTDMECAPCFSKRAACYHRNCMKLIRPKDVIQAAERILSEL